MAHVSTGRDESCAISAGVSCTAEMAARLSAMCWGDMERGLDGRPTDQRKDRMTCAGVTPCAAAMAKATAMATATAQA